VLGIPCLTLRENTERPITVTQGTNVIVGTDSSKIVEQADRTLADAGRPHRVPDLWDGKAADRIVEAVRVFLRSPSSGVRSQGPGRVRKPHS
jgi:UDP-N-acetylglucosamine 2-epimerase (non-hydrolysing)